NKNKVKAIILTHGHEDHIGGLPFLFKEINAPVFATKLTIGLTKIKFDNSQKAIPIKYNEINPDKPLDIGPFHIDFFRVNHSIPDGLGLIIKNSIQTCFNNNMANKTMIEDFINDRLEKFIFKKARIRPIIITKVISPDKH
ncbi:unnamed protein product, partial [marine sediment metagenome]